MQKSGLVMEFKSDDVMKITFLKLCDLLGYSERTTSERPTCQKCAFQGKLSVTY